MLIVEMFSLFQVCSMIMACCVLHNIALKNGVPLALEPPHQQPDEGPEPFLGQENLHAVQVRQELVFRM